MSDLLNRAHPVQLPSGHFDQWLPQIFANATWFIKEFQAYIMVGTAMAIAFAMITIIAGLFERKKKDDDDVDYEHY